MNSPQRPEPGRLAKAELEALDALDARIARARERLEPKARKPWGGGKYAGASMAWRMVVELMIGCALGGLIGWGLDKVFGIFPFMTVVFGLLGLAAGVKTMLRSLKEADNSARRS